MTRIVCHQLAPQIGDPAGNRAASVAAIAAAVDAGAGVVVLPELVTSGYVFESAEEVAAARIRCSLTGPPRRRAGRRSSSAGSASVATTAASTTAGRS